MQFYKNGNSVELCELYDAFMKQDDPTTFKKWIFEKFTSGEINIHPSARKNISEMKVQWIRARKKKIKSNILDQHVNALVKAGKLSQKGRKKERERFQNLLEFFTQCEEAFSTDIQLLSLEDEDYLNEKYNEYLKQKEHEDRIIISREIQHFLEGFLIKEIESLDFVSFNFYIDDIVLNIQKKLDKELMSSTLYVSCVDYDDYYPRYYSEDLDVENLNEFLREFTDDPEGKIAGYVGDEDYLDGLVLDYLIQNVIKLKELSLRYDLSDITFALNEKYDYEIYDLKSAVVDSIDCTEEHILECLSHNPHYHDIREQSKEYKKQIEEEKRKIEKEKQSIKDSILSVVPDNYVDMYPLARKLKRKFYLHIGPTNSGKTFAAIQALKNNSSGIYLAPLRLLAFEQYESLNQQGYPCSLITGEENRTIVGAKYQCSTIEMADLKKQYSFAVIDESQMISDPIRGGAWTSVILGLCCKEIHVCAAPYAEEILIKVIQECNDDYEVIYHTRETDLLIDEKIFHFPDSVRSRDALIVFSKRNVHAVALYLQSEGIKCSVIYGSLPYDVRQDEARKFADGETDVLVSTDAVGMGMNLPIQRIVFLETKKYDGTTNRKLTPDEIQQIAGRAGRQGIYDIGFVTSDLEKSFVKESLFAKIVPIETATISFPESLIGIDVSLSDTLTKWTEIQTEGFFKKQNISIMLEKCLFLERYTDQKELIYSFLKIPFDEKDKELKNIWKSMFFCEQMKDQFQFKDIISKITEHFEFENLDLLEKDYKKCDLIYYYMSYFYPDKNIDTISACKKSLSLKMIQILKKQKLKGKICRCCGKTMPWNYEYGLCEFCYSNEYGIFY